MIMMMMMIIVIIIIVIIMMIMMINNPCELQLPNPLAHKNVNFYKFR